VQLPLDQLGFGNLPAGALAAIQQQLLPLLNSITARTQTAANAFRQGAAFGHGRGLLQDDAASSSVISLADYYALVDSRIRPTLESLGTDNATIVQLVNSTASFLYSLEAFPGDVNFATRAAQVGWKLLLLQQWASGSLQEKLHKCGVGSSVTITRRAALARLEMKLVSANVAKRVLVCSKLYTDAG
jgi:hypothetical protein